VPSADEAVITTAHTYNTSADAWRAYHGEDRTDWQPTYKRFTELVPRDSRVLDLGCGPGLDAPALTAAGLRCIGLDVSVRLLELAAKEPALIGRVMLGDLRSLPYTDGAFDAVWAGGSMHHIARSEIKAALAEVARVTKVGGVFMASVERGDGEGYAVDLDNVADARWYACYEPDEWRAMLRRLDFAMVDAQMGDPSKHSRNGWFAIFARKR